MPKRKVTFVVPAIVVLALSFSASANAYLDPGTGSMILQVIVAGAFAGIMYAKLAWAQTKSFFRRMVGAEPQETDVDIDPEVPEQDIDK